MRRLLALLAVTAAVLLPAVPAAADDTFEIDSRLVDAGFADAWTNYSDGDRGSRVSVDYDTSSADQAAYDQEAAEIARLVWEHLEVRVLAVDVAPTSGVAWLDGQVPPAVTWNRADLEREHGARGAGLDDNVSAYGDEWIFVVGSLGVVAVIGAALGFLGGWLVGRRRKPDPWAGGPGGYGGYGAPGGAWGAPQWGPPGSGGWGAPGSAPGAWPGGGASWGQQ
jgi:hypothetical protein